MYTHHITACHWAPLLLGSVGVPAPIIRHLWYTNWEYMPGKEAAGLYIVHHSPGGLHLIYLLQYRVHYSIQQYTEKKRLRKKMRSFTTGAYGRCITLYAYTEGYVAAFCWRYKLGAFLTIYIKRRLKSLCQNC